MNVIKFNSYQKLEELYKKCYKSSKYNHYFQTHEIMKETDTLYYRLRFKSGVQYYAVFKQEMIILIAAFRKINRNKLVIIGGQEGYDFCDFVYGTDDMGSLLDAIKDLIKYLKSSGIRFLEFRFWNQSSPSYRIFKELGIELFDEKKVKNTTISLQYPDYDTYLSTISKHVRQNLRTSMNRIAKDGFDYKYSIYMPDSSVKQLKEQSKIYLDLYLNRQANKYNGNSYMHQVFLKKYNYITNSVINERAIMADIKINGKIAAFLQGGVSSDNIKFEVPRLAIDDSYGRYSPGMLLVLDTIKFLINNSQIREFNLCRGDEDYKYKMGGVNYFTICCLAKI